jgi:transposase
VSQIERWISQHLLGLLTRTGGADHGRPAAWDRPAGRRAKRFLAPSQQDEIWLQLVGGETTVSDAADRLEVDRSTIMCICEVARQGAQQALATSRPGPRQGAQDTELAAAKAEVARLSETVKELAVKLLLVEGKGRWG